MFGNEVDEAIREIEEFCKALSQIQPTTNGQKVAIEKARAQAARIAEQLRKLKSAVPAHVENTG